MDKTLQITLPDLQKLQAHVKLVRNKARGERPSVVCKKLEHLSFAESTAYKWLQGRGTDPQEGELELYDEDVQIIIWRLQGYSYGQIGRWLSRSHQWIVSRVQWLKPHHLPPFIKISWIKGEGKARPLEAQRYWAWIIAWQRIHRDPESALIWLEKQAASGNGRGLWAPDH